jgi:hypothetical protein
MGTLADAGIGITKSLTFVSLAFRRVMSENLRNEGIIHRVVYNRKQIVLCGASALEQRNS